MKNKMKILIDLTCEGGALLFNSMIRRLKERGHEVHVTSRKYEKANQLQKELGLNVTVLGDHGGASLYGKLMSYAERVKLLSNYMASNDIDSVISNAGPSACRAGYGLGLKVYTWNDMPEAEAQTRLTIPLSSWVFTPWIIPKKEFTKYGMPEEKIFQYQALYPLMWLPEIKVNPDILDDLALDPDKPVIVFRESERRAAYLIGKEPLVIQSIRMLAEKFPEKQFIARARYDDTQLKSALRGLSNVQIFDQPIDLQSLLAKADLLIGGGATMNIEAAYYGTPVIACRPIEVRYERYLLNEGLAVKAHSTREVIEYENELIKKRNDSLAKKVFDKMKYPLEEIIDIMERI